MNVFKIRILVDDQDDFIREVEIKGNQTFKGLHDFIVKSLKLGGNELASFHITDHNWNKLREITLIDMMDNPANRVGRNNKLNQILLMSKTRLDMLLSEIDEKMLYEYDFLQMHTFRLEVVDVQHAEPGKSYPLTSYSRGVLQLRENVKVEKDPDKLKNELLNEFNSILHDDDDDDYDLDDDY